MASIYVVMEMDGVSNRKITTSLAEAQAARDSLSRTLRLQKILEMHQADIYQKLMDHPEVLEGLFDGVGIAYQGLIDSIVLENDAKVILMSRDEALRALATGSVVTPSA